MLDTDADPCQLQQATDLTPLDMAQAPCFAYGKNKTEIKFSHGGVRPGAGRKPKPVPVIDRNPHWSVIAFFGQAEMSASAELTRIGYTTYLPMVAVRRRDPVIASMFHTVRVPYFSGYGFIRITAFESREPILAVRGVRDLLRRPDGRPSWVSSAEVEDLQADDDTRLVLPKSHAPALAPKSTAVIDTGPFLGCKATVIECDGVKTRVEIDMFGRIMPVWVDRTALCPSPP